MAWLRIRRGVGPAGISGIVLLAIPGLYATAVCAAAGYHIEVIAHRGASYLAPENTYAAAQRCIDLGVDYLEVDVQPSKDGVLYNLHDLGLNRTTNGQGSLLSKLSSEVDQLDAGSWFGPEFAGERVPRFDQFLPWLKGKIKVNFDIRGGDMTQLISLVRANHMEQDCFFRFISPPLALRFHVLAPDLTIKVDVQTPEAAEEAALRYHASIIETSLPALTPALLDACRKHALKIIVCAAENTREEYEEILRSPADMVMLDRPDLFLEVQQEQAKK